MSSVQKLFKTILPKSWGESMEAESRDWMMKCDDCGTERSVWDIGGIRWKAKWTPKSRVPCQPCGKSTWHTTYKRTP